MSERIPDARVFMDLDSIEAGLDFAEVIREAVDSCAVLVALIGRQWATLADEEGRRRLDNPDDFVRFEVRAALERGVRVIPVLVDGARPLRQQQLPAELHKLARLNALELSYGRYEYDADRLLNLIQRVLVAASGTGTLHQSPPAADAEALAVIHEVRPDGNALAEAAQRDPKAVRTDRPRARLLADAERIAWSISDESSRASALADIAAALAATDPDRAARLLADAERIAQSITSEIPGAIALVSIVKALAATDPDRAERIAQSITDEHLKANALLSIVKALATTDPDRAERIAQSITTEFSRSSALAGIAKALAVTDPDRAARLIADAEGIARSITDEYFKASALASVAAALAVTDPDRAARLIADAEGVAQSITDELLKASALANVAKALAITDLDRAERIAQSITDERWKAMALVTIAEA